MYIDEMTTNNPERFCILMKRKCRWVFCLMINHDGICLKTEGAAYLVNQHSKSD